MPYQVPVPETLAAKFSAPRLPSRSPFILQFLQRLRPWSMPAVRGRNLTRRAGLSTCRASYVVCAARRCEASRRRAIRAQQRAKNAGEAGGTSWAGGLRLPLSQRRCWRAAAPLAQSQFPDQARAHLCAISGRRRRRHPVAHARRRRVQAMGPDGGGREPPGRRRPGRVAGAGAIAARRLHADHGGERPSPPIRSSIRNCPTTPSRISRRSRCSRRRRTSCWCARIRRSRPLPT